MGDASSPSYGIADTAAQSALRLRMAEDTKLLTLFSQELRTLADEFTATQRSFTGRAGADIGEADSDAMESLLFRYVVCRESLVEMAGAYTSPALAGMPWKDVSTTGSLLGFFARLMVRYYDALLAGIFMDEPFAVGKLNAAYPDANLPAGFLATVTDAATALDNREAQEASWRLFAQERSNPHSTLSRLVQLDPECAMLVRAIEALHPRQEEAGRSLVTRQATRDSRIQARTNPARVALLQEKTRAATGSDLDAAVALSTRGIFQTVAAWVADPLRLTAAQTAQVKSLIQPGDIVLTYRAGYLTNLVFPGKFKHGMTYVGEQAALDTHATAGSRFDVIEAVMPSVTQNSLDYILGAHINRLAVIRPRFTDTERAAAFAKLFGYMGRPYDLAFNFKSDARLCCMEVAHHVINGRGGVRFSLVKRMGLMTLSADDILGQTVTTATSGTDLVLLIDAKPKGRKGQAIVLTGAPAAAHARHLLER